jgi:predicted enzyme related to lactoylglutathione lyase
MAVGSAIHGRGVGHSWPRLGGVDFLRTRGARVKPSRQEATDMTDTHTGRFVWYELLTTDPEGAKGFYGEVLGWKTQPFGDNGYQMWVGAQGPLGGVMQLPDAAKKMGAPPHWMAQIEVADLDETLAKARALGAKVYVEPEHVPTVGRFAVMGDPQGAVFAAFQLEQPMAPHDGAKHGEFCWRELITSDKDAALGFYSALFGWEKVLEHDLGPVGTYRIFGRGERQWGGMFTATPDMKTPTAWLYYVNVDDLDATLARATRHGATVLSGPMEVPGGARVAQLTDPQGTAFGLHCLKAKS